ncbi:MAG: hypothetical protein IT267_08620 [Saprospiraceae bacterium]|nr:hypothetical protein [Saprospiraceae bacterium]
MSQIDDFKRKFLENLRLHFKNKKNWADELSTILNCTKASVYKKMSDENFFLLSDIILLTKHFGLSLDKIIYEDLGRVNFIAHYVTNPIHEVEQYLEHLTNIFTQINQLTNPTVYYATRELPIFYYFLNGPLTLFKLYVFSRTIWKIESFKGAKFSESLFKESIVTKSRLLADNFSKLKSIEYWNSNILDSTMQQLMFYTESGDLSLNDAHLILDGLLEVIKTVKEATLVGHKNPLTPSNFELYENKILHTNNHILLRSDQYCGLYITFDNPNFLFTEDKEFLEYTFDWYNTIEDNSYQLGHGSGHHTSIFFTSLERKVLNLKNKLDILTI